MDHVPEIEIGCPYCGEVFATRVDTGPVDGTYVEDCPVCCAPIDLAVRWPPEGGPPEVTPAREDD